METPKPNKGRGTLALLLLVGAAGASVWILSADEGSGDPGPPAAEPEAPFAPGEFVARRLEAPAITLELPGNLILEPSGPRTLEARGGGDFPTLTITSGPAEGRGWRRESYGDEAGVLVVFETSSERLTCQAERPGGWHELALAICESVRPHERPHIVEIRCESDKVTAEDAVREVSRLERGITECFVEGMKLAPQADLASLSAHLEFGDLGMPIQVGIGTDVPAFEVHKSVEPCAHAHFKGLVWPAGELDEEWSMDCGMKWTRY